MSKRGSEAAGLATALRPPPPPPPPPLPAAGSRLGGTDGQKYELGELLGEGAFATVHRAKCVASCVTYALKLIDKDGTNLAEARRERNILERVGLHKHIVGLFDSFVQPSNWVLVLELAEGGEVFERICDGGPFSEADAASVVRQVVLALQHVHGLGVVHRDLKPENLLLVSQAAEAHVKVADFGLASLLGEPPAGENNEVAGTITYMAPELLGPDALGEGALPVGPGVDVWSLGVVLFNLLSGYQPFDPKGNAADDELQRRISAAEWGFSDFPDRWQHVSAAAQRLVSGMLHPSAAQRLSCEQILASTWLGGKDGEGGEGGEGGERVQGVEGAASAAPLPGSETMLRDFNEVRKTWRGAVHAAALVLQLPGALEAQPSAGAAACALPTAAEEELRTLFAALDTDGSGSLELPELRRLVRMLGADEQVAARLLSTMDTDHDGAVGFAEFCVVVAPLYSTAGGQLRAAFDLFDTDGSGSLDRAEMAAIFSRLDVAGASRPEVMAKLFDEADADHDDKISFDEFCRYVNKAAAAGR